MPLTASRRFAVVVWVCVFFLVCMGTVRIMAENPQQQVARAAALHSVHQAFAWFHANEPQLEKWQLELARIPGPPFGEKQRSAWVRQRFQEVGLKQVEVDELGDVYGLLAGSDPAAELVAVTAHIDTVFPVDAPLDVREQGGKLYGPGIADNGAGVVGMLAVAAALKASPVAHRSGILFIGNVGEEGEGDLRGMRHIFSDSRWRDRIAYTVVLDGAGTDTYVTHALGSKRLRVIIHGPGGHSWSDFGAPNPIVVAARAIARFSESSVPADPKTTFNVGVIRGGTSVNSIPEQVSFRVDMRSAAPEQIERLEELLRRALEEAVEQERTRAGSPPHALTLEIKTIGDRPAADLPDDARILEVLRAVDSHLGLHARPRRASTDANVPMSLGRQAVSMGAGGSGGGAHTLHEWYDPAGRDLGLKRILLTTLTLAGVPQ